MKVAVILPAAGLGTRMGRTQPETGGTSRKQFMLLDGAPILVHTIRKFAASPLVGEIVVALRAEDIEWFSELLRREAPGKPVRLVEAGIHASSRWRTRCPRSRPIRSWWRYTTRCGRSWTRRPSPRW